MAVRALFEECCRKWKVEKLPTYSPSTLADTTPTGLDIEKVEWETKEVIVHTKSDTPTYEEVEAKIAKTGVS